MFKGKKMAGQMGNASVTTQNLRVVETDVDRGLILVRGAVPGCQRRLGAAAGRGKEIAAGRRAHAGCLQGR